MLSALLNVAITIISLCRYGFTDVAPKGEKMLEKIRNNHGFTLIELLIVVAIIGILAAIAIPQFSAYRLKAYNNSALTDLRNLKVAVEAVMIEEQTYPPEN